uniref:Uncharacterized protein n=1 Tax=Anguilla anguilla TaxID=7936 RepID=A0A0E9QXV6_ANGAN
MPTFWRVFLILLIVENYLCFAKMGALYMKRAAISTWLHLI